MAPSAHGDQLISAKPRGTACFERPSYVTRWRRTGRLERRDSNLCISESEFVKSFEIPHRFRADCERRVVALRLFRGLGANVECGTR
jgi:hypothetical protein